MKGSDAALMSALCRPARTWNSGDRSWEGLGSSGNRMNVILTTNSPFCTAPTGLTVIVGPFPHASALSITHNFSTDADAQLNIDKTC